MDVIRFADATAFASRAEPFLLRHEAEHNLALGIIGGLRRFPQPSGQPPYLALVERAGAVVAVAVRTALQLILSRVEASHAPDALDRLVADVALEGEVLPGVVGPAAVARAFAERWSVTTGQAARRTTAMRIYQLDAVLPGTAVPGALRPATPADGDLVTRWIAAFWADLGEPADAAAARRTTEDRLRAGGLHLWDTGQPVAMANAGGATPHGIRINLVYTPPEYRRRGYASACVAALSQAMLDAGRRFCFLYTDLDNPTSNHIYQHIGYQPVADADAYRFLSPSGDAPYVLPDPRRTYPDAADVPQHQSVRVPLEPGWRGVVDRDHTTDPIRPGLVQRLGSQRRSAGAALGGRLRCRSSSLSGTPPAGASSPHRR